MIEQGIYIDLSSEEYHSEKSSFSRSSIMDFKKSPRKYWAKHLNPDRPKEEPKPSWVFGTAFHTLILEPHLFEKNYFVLPEKVLLKNVGREVYDQFKSTLEEAETTKKIVLSLEDYERLSAMQDAVFANPRAKGLIEAAVFESSYFWKDEHSGLMVKSRPDILNGNIYADLKTIDDASPENFQREMAKYSYHVQAAMVKDGYKQLTGENISACINVCVEHKYPYSIGIYIIDETAIETGHYTYKQILLDLRSALANNDFRDYEVQTIGLPKWAL
jgi:hypothetical protein